MQPIKVSAVNYLNTRPFIRGLEEADIREKIILTQDYPAICAEKLLNGDVDVALVPVAVIPFLEQPQIISDFCIGADGPVKTVCLFSEVPLDEIETIYLDYQSRTSVRLVQVLCEEYWHIHPRMVKAYPGYMSEIKENVAGVIIGDRATAFLEQFPHVYDLADHWKQFTGLPFVFAAWVANKPLDKEFIDAFNQALQLGLEQREAVGKDFAHLNNSRFDTVEYLQQNISYLLDDAKKEGMMLFMEKLCRIEGVSLPNWCFADVG